MEYEETFNNLRNELTNYNELKDITREFTNGKIYFIKYTNSFSSVKTSSKVSEAYMQLTPDASRFNIFIKKEKELRTYRYQLESHNIAA